MAWRFVAEIVTACFTALLGLAVAIGSLEYGIGWGKSGPEPGCLPFAMGAIVMLASLGTIATSVKARDQLAGAFLDREKLLRVLTFFAPMVAFLLLALALGLYVATALYLAGVMAIQGRYHPAVAGTVGVGVALAFYVILEIGFSVSLLKGPLERLLGLH